MDVMVFFRNIKTPIKAYTIIKSLKAHKIKNVKIIAILQQKYSISASIPSPNMNSKKKNRHRALATTKGTSCNSKHAYLSLFKKGCRENFLTFTFFSTLYLRCQAVVVSYVLKKGTI